MPDDSSQKKPDAPAAAQAAGTGAAAPALSDRPWLWALAIFAVALTLRGLYIWQLSATPMAHLPLGDAAAYDTWATQIEVGDWNSKGQGVFYQAPLYPYFLVAVYKVAGEHSFMAVRLVQILAGALACVALYAAGRWWFGPVAGRIAGFLLACYPAAIYFDGLIQKASLAIACLCALLACLAWAWQRDRLLPWFLAGLWFGVWLMLRENAMALVVVLIPAALWVGGREAPPMKRRYGRAALLLAGAALAVLPVLIHNYRVSGEIHLTTYQLGPNLWYGNNLNSDGFYVPFTLEGGNWRHERLDANRLAAAALGHEPTPKEVSGYWVSEVLRYIRENPGHWLRLTAYKTWIFFNRIEIGDTTSQYQFARDAWMLRPFDFFLNASLLLAVAVLGVGATWQRRRELWPLVAMALLYAATTIAFIVYARYRMPVVPFLILFAAAAFPGFRAWQRRGGAVYYTSCVLALLVLAVSWWPAANRRHIVAASYFNVAVALQDEQNLPAAEEYLQLALKWEPDYAFAHAQLAAICERQARPEAAMGHYRAAVDALPANPTLRAMLASALIRRGDLKGAEKHGREAVRLQPAFVEAHYNLGLALLRQGFFAQAETEFATAMELRGRPWPELHNELGAARLHRGETDAAITEFEAALAVRPDYLDAIVNLAAAYSVAARPDDSVATYQRALAIDPAMPEAHTNLGVVLLGQGDLISAETHFRKAIAVAPNSPGALSGLAYVLAKRGNLDEAISRYEQVMRITPNDIDTARNLVALKKKRGDKMPDPNGQPQEEEMPIQINTLDNLRPEMFDFNKKPQSEVQVAP